MSKLIDTTIYIAGLGACGFLALKWDKNLYIYNNAKRNLRKVISMKYGILPQPSYYQKLNTNTYNWENINDIEETRLKNINILFPETSLLDFTDFNISINQDKYVDTNKLTLIPNHLNKI